MLDSTFAGTVVLLCETGPKGAVGLVLNRPIDLQIKDVLENPGAWGTLSAPLSWGGPVGQEQLHALHSGEPSDSLAQEVMHGLTFGAELESLIVLQTMGEHLRFFVGYAGWESGQLEAELDQDGWHLTPATPSCVFETPPERLWHHLIAKTSPSLSWLKHLPDDPSMN